MEVWIKGKKISLNPWAAVGKGGEADIYDLGDGCVLKIFKPPSHPDYDGLPLEQEGARQRIALHQAKLPAFPGNLPERVVVPLDLARSKAGGAIVGYTMRFLKCARVLRSLCHPPPGQGALDRNDAVRLLLDLHGTVSALHASGVVIGDFNDLNVLVQYGAAYLIDADSFQFGRFPCTVFTVRFADPSLCAPAPGGFVLAKPYTTDSDWYAYAVMAMEGLLCLDPYGGVYAPADPSMRMPHGARPLNRITIFHPEVRYPKSALPLDALPDDMINHFREVFLRDKRGEFPRDIIENIQWQTCGACGAPHTRSHCPRCVHFPPDATREVTVIRGTVTCSRIFSTTGSILAAAARGGRLQWVFHEGGAFRREDGTVITKGELRPEMRFGLADDCVWAGEGGRVLLLRTGGEPESLNVDTFENGPAFDACGRAMAWIRRGVLLRKGAMTPEHMGEVLEGQTFIRLGPAFGFGFYRAGGICTAFLFKEGRRGLKDTLSIPWLRRKVTAADCFFTQERCWLFLAVEEQGRTVHRCILLNQSGAVEGTAEAVAGDGSWLGTLHGKCPAGDFLLSPTDEGVVRVEARRGALVKVKEFPDTRGFVNESTALHTGKGGIFAVGIKEVNFLAIR
jgi:hypothetical protein